jgi:hypothetical protein
MKISRGNNGMNMPELLGYAYLSWFPWITVVCMSHRTIISFLIALGFICRVLYASYCILPLLHVTRLLLFIQCLFCYLSSRNFCSYPNKWGSGRFEISIMSIQQVTADVTPVLPFSNIMYMRWSITLDLFLDHLMMMSVVPPVVRDMKCKDKWNGICTGFGRKISWNNFRYYPAFT